MSSGNLRQRASAAAASPAGDDPGWPAAAQPGTGAPPPEPAPERLDPVEAPEGLDEDPPAVPVHVAIARVMRDLGKIAKADRFDGGNAGKYNFRGVDRVVNAVSAVIRKHGVIVVPELVSADYRDVPRKEGGRSHECIVKMNYRWIGPAGDERVATVGGEALDTSDKSTAKAESVAWRVCLIQMLAIPTGDPDPDSVRIERGEQPVPKASDYRDEILHPDTSLGRLKQMRHEIATHNLASVLVINEVNDEEKLGDLLQRIGRERQAAVGGAQ